MTYLTSAVMSAEVISISESGSVNTAINLMKANGIRHLPVVNDSNELAGILSTKDVARARDENECVKNIMSTPVRIVSRRTNVKSVIDVMLKNKISSLLVANEKNVVGIVTTDDLLKLLSQVLEDKDDLDSFDVGSFFDDAWTS